MVYLQYVWFLPSIKADNLLFDPPLSKEGPHADPGGVEYTHQLQHTL